MKKIIITLVLLGLVLPGVVGAQAKQPTKLEACTLKHDLTSVFGPDYIQGRTIVVNEEVAAKLMPEGDFPAAGFPVKDIGTADRRAFSLAIKGIVKGVGGLLGGTGCKNAAQVIADELDKKDPKTGEYTGTITKTMYDDLKKNCGGIPLVGGKLAKALQFLMKTAGVTSYYILPEAGTACLYDLIETFADWFFVFLLVIAGVFILWGAYTFISAGGAPEKLKTARNILIWACVGIAVAFISKGLVKLIEQLISA